jgi:hypothetical protein
VECTPFLTDQFGERYDIEGGLGVGVGPFPAIFDPLRGQASTQGASITLRCLGLSGLAIRLTGTLKPHSAHELGLPAASVVDETTYQVVGLRWSGTYLEVHTKMTGKLIDELIARSDAIAKNPPPGGGGVTFPGVFVITPSGEAEIPVAVLNSRDIRQGLKSNHVLDEVRVFTASKPGTYRIMVNTDGPKGTAIASWTVTVR